ncbi:MAG: hypothetical protein Q8R00_01510 [Candidatus Nanoarchaeia archaeon]|nr:hypothetical protein [Candidatus Nanoarchaeia archaeon]
MTKPKRFFGRDPKENLKKVLASLDSKKETPEPQPKPKIIIPEGLDKEDYIYLPSRNLYIAKQKTHFNKNWYQSHESLHKEDARMLTIPEFLDFLEALKNGNDEFKNIYNEITEKRDPWRAEHLDAYFTNNNGLKISYNHRIINGKLVPQNTESLDSCVMEECYADLSSLNKQGLPAKKSRLQKYKQGDNVYFWHPIDEAVAGFDAGSDWVGLFCGWNPRGSGSDLGVRQAREKI